MMLMTFLFGVSVGACFGTVLMGALIGDRQELPKPYGSHQEWNV